MAGQMLDFISPPMTGPPGRSSCGSTSPKRAMSSTGTTTWSSRGLRVPASTMTTSRPAPVPPRNLAMVWSGRCVAERPMRWSGRAPGPGTVPAPARRRSRRSMLRARCAPRFDPAIAWTSSTITCSTPRRMSRAWLVSSRYRLSGVVTRMSGGCLHEVAALVGRGVAGPRGDRDVRRLLAEPLGRQRDAGEGRPQVPLHVVREGLERADVQHPDGAPVLPGWGGPRVTDEAVQAPQERGEGLAAAGRRVDQRAAAGADRRPSLCLGLGGRLERRLEPGPHGGPEGRERIGDGHGHGRASIGPHRHVVQMFVLAAHPACRSGKPRHDSEP